VAVRPGAAALDGPLDGGWLLDRLGGGFTGVWFSPEGRIPEAVARTQAALAQRAVPVKQVAVVSPEAICARYSAERDPAYYLFRPDGHVAARWRHLAPGAAEGALKRATAIS
jgi:3-(3-hydroxy-phenyl)propionate hydroxylase